METFLNILDGLAIARWEVIFFALLISVYTLMGLYRSCFIIAFGFTFYWGLKSFFSLSVGLSQRFLILYGVSGLVIIGLISLSYLFKECKRV